MKMKTERALENLLLILFPAAIIVGCAGNGEERPQEFKDNQVSMLEYDKAVSQEYQATTTPLNTAYVEPLSEANASVVPDVIKEDIVTQETVTEEISTATPIPAVKTLYFDTDKFTVVTDDYQILQQHAHYLLKNPDSVVTINGHADERGTDAYNQHLSEQRAKEVKTIFISLGVQEKQIILQGFGETHPLNDAKLWQENRRVELDYSDSMVSQAW